MRVIVYTLPNCQPCRVTKHALTKHGIPYEEVSMGANPEHLIRFRQWGATQSPVVEVIADDGQTIDWWHGFKHARILQLAENPHGL